jgi:hypothetical protein
LRDGGWWELVVGSVCDTTRLLCCGKIAGSAEL